MGLWARIDRRSIVSRVFILQGAGWLTLLLLVGTTVWSSSRELTEVAYAGQQQLAHVVADELDQAIAGDLARVQALSGSPSVLDLGVARATFASAFHGAALIESIRLIDRHGTVIVREPAGAPEIPLDTDRMRQAFEAATLRAVPVSPHALRAEILMPLSDPQGETVALAGVLLNAQTRMVDDLLAAGRATLVPSATPTKGARAELSVAPWAVVSAAEVPHVAIAARRTLWWSLPLSLALALVFAWGTARGVRRPVEALTAAAERMAGGDLETPLPTGPEGDEIGRLARVLERLRLALHRDAWRRETLRKVISAQEEERRRIARELHDDTAQVLAAVTVSLDAALDGMPAGDTRSRLENLKALAHQSLSELHRVIYDLRPSVLDDLGLAAAIRWLAEEHTRRTGVSIRVECYGLDQRLPSDTETAIFRVIQEALTNIERHAAAETVLLQVSRENGTLTVEIEDDGKGFEPATIDPTAGSARGLGLQGMRERIELLGGSFALTSTPGSGTRIVVGVPS